MANLGKLVLRCVRVFGFYIYFQISWSTKKKKWKRSASFFFICGCKQILSSYSTSILVMFLGKKNVFIYGFVTYD